MKHLIIGTAGHIDHGKTTLIHALTGRQTDRLKEEQKRGISIELGFTYFDLPHGRRAGIVDVPGHERFVRHMLAGVGGMDLVMLVVAADEGVMPQTREHLDILSMLTVKTGIIVITKSSLVDTEWLELVKEDIRQCVSETFLSDSPMIPVDSITGEGIDDLIQTLTHYYDAIEARDQKASLRIPIDRVFTITGFGTVVTGTLIEGTVHTEDTVSLYPHERTVRIRNIQVHGETVQAAYAGQRVALNVTGLKKNELSRGHFLAAPASMRPTMMVDCRLTLLKSAPRSISQRDRVRVYHGTAEIFARVVILGQEEIQPGESAIVQLRLEETAAFKNNDRLIIRFYSPMVTLGGALVIEPNPEKHRSDRQEVIDTLKAKETGGPEVYVEQQLIRYSQELPGFKQLTSVTGYDQEELKRCLSILLEEDRVVFIEPGIYLHPAHYQSIKSDTTQLMTEYHQNNPLRKGMPKEEIKSRLFPKNKSKAPDHVLEKMESDNIIRSEGVYIAAHSFQIVLTPSQQQLRKSLEALFLEDLFAPPRTDDLPALLGEKPGNVQQMLEMITGDVLIRVGSETLFHRHALTEAKNKLLVHFQTNETITVAQYRDLLQASRKNAVLLLEHFDQEKTTIRKGDVRVLQPRKAST